MAAPYTLFLVLLLLKLNMLDLYKSLQAFYLPNITFFFFFFYQSKFSWFLSPPEQNSSPKF